ncbi:hypothetical protein ACFV4P_09540 [Kitasatospora sp. NPDC059795]|uniref:hypothetical protein n=1 Tax=Kitasatospora sp. NPDC059795 TaxID=3346949 RepID=UPI00364EC08B
MNKEELRDALPELADLAGPAQLDVEGIAQAVRRRRTRSGLAAGAVLAVAAGVAATAAVLPTGPAAVGAAGPGEGGEPTVIGVPAGAYTCGRPLPDKQASTTVNGITLSVSSVRRAGDGTGPAVDVAYRADRSVDGVGVPPEYLETLYVKDGVVVGGGPLLNRPGDTEAQGVDALGHPVRLEAGVPKVEPLGERNTLCGSLTWQQVWAEPERYEVVVRAAVPFEPGAPGGVTTRLLEARSPLAR